VKYLKQWKQNGDWRIRLRRRGFKEVELKPPPGYRGVKSTLANSPSFLAAYLAAMAEPVTPLKPGETRSTYGSVNWLVAEYFDSLDFKGRPASMRVKHRRYIEDFRAKRGGLPVAKIEAEHLEKMFATMLATPAKANQWLKAIRDLMRYATKRKLLVANPASDIKKRPSNNPDGHWTWEPEEVATAREKFEIGTKMRLAIEMMNALAFRRSDVIRVGPPNTYAGFDDDGRPCTMLRHVQHKGRERHPSHIDTPIPADLLTVMKATPTVGIRTWLVDGRGKPFNEIAFSHWFTAEIKRAGLPSRCTPHGLRKRCCTDLANEGKNPHQIMAVSGHLTLSEVQRYTRMYDRARNAREAMRGRT
jgi:integrase